MGILWALARSRGRMYPTYLIVILTNVHIRVSLVRLLGGTGKFGSLPSSLRVMVSAVFNSSPVHTSLRLSPREQEVLFLYFIVSGRCSPT